MPEEITPISAFADATIGAIQELTESLGHYPAPVDVASKLSITRQTLYQRLKVLELAGLIERLNHGHALKVVQPAGARP